MLKALFFAFALFSGAISVAGQPVPESTGLITDEAGLISGAEAASLEARMKSLEDATGAKLQILVLLVKERH